MIVANHQPQYLPYLGFFHKVARCDRFVVLDDVQFLERGHQHRNTIKMQTGAQWITVPVRQRRGQLISEVLIDPESNWRKKHWAALQTNYGPAPHWKALSPSLRTILVEGSHSHLWQLDLELLRWAMDLLEIRTPWQLASEIPNHSAGDPTARHIEICRALGADTYLSGAGGRNYMNLALFEAAGVTVEFQIYEAREYPQLFPKLGFLPNLSVVDALFNLGSDARRLIA